MGLKSKLWPPSSCRSAEKVKDTQLDLNFRSMTSYWVLFSCSDVSDSLQPHELQHARLPCPHHLPEFAHTYVHWVGDAIQPSHPPFPPSLLPSIFPSINVFSNESTLHIKWPKYWSFSFSISFPVNIQGWFPLRLTGLISLLSKGLSRVFSLAPQFKSISSVVLSLLDGLALTSLHDYQKNHDFD